MSTENTTSRKEKSFFSKSRILFYVFAVILFALVIYYLSSIKKDIKLLGKVDVAWLLLAILGQVCTYFFTALVYQKLLKMFKVDEQLSLWQLFKASIVVLFTDQIIPSGGISGNGFIFGYLSKRNIPSEDSFSVIILQLLTYYTSMEIIIVAGCFLSLFIIHFSQLFIVVLASGFGAYLLFALIITFIGKKETVIKLTEKFARIKFIRKFINKFSESFSGESLSPEMSKPWAYFSKHKIIIATILLFHFCVFFADAFTIFALFRGLGITLSFIAAFIGYLLTRIISLLPVSPGSLILYESGMTFFLTKLGAPLGTSIVVTLLYRFLSFWMPMPIGFFLFRKTTTTDS